MFNFTQQEKTILLFLIVMFCAGGIIHLIRQNYPHEIMNPAERDSVVTLFMKGSERADSMTVNPENHSIKQDSTSLSLININTASTEELKTLPGIGAKTAQNIIEYRNAHGYFSSIEDLLDVKGIGVKTLEKIREEITVE